MTRPVGATNPFQSFNFADFGKKRVESQVQDSGAAAQCIAYTGPNIGNILNGSASGQTASNL